MASDSEPLFEGKKTRAEVEDLLASGNYDQHGYGRKMKHWIAGLDARASAERAHRQEKREGTNLNVARWALVVALLSLVVSVVLPLLLRK